MNILTICLSIILSILATSIMSYISLATPIGPWIAPTLVLIALLCSKLFIKTITTELACSVAAGSVGGIMATACAFSLPTLYFLDPTIFNTWMSSPMFFCTIVGIFSLLAGICGLIVANASENTLIVEQNLAFPIGQLTHKMIASTNQIKKAYELMIGFIATTCFCILQTGLSFVPRILPHTISIIPTIKYGILAVPRITMQLEMMPMVCAIGFVTGHVIALPLSIGALSNITIIHSLQKYFFSDLSTTEFTLAFCSGMVLFVTTLSLLEMPQQIIRFINTGINTIKNHTKHAANTLNKKTLLSFLAFIGGFVGFFSYFQMPLTTQLYLLVCSLITTYQIAAIAGRIGLALLGRFATFVMVPAMLFFNINYTHIVFIATFVEMSGGCAADVLFGRKLAQLTNISSKTIQQYQILGLIISSLTIGIVFWILIHHFGLGSPELFAYRAQSRQLLIQAQNFNYVVMILGGLFGTLLKHLNLNPMLVLGGLLMPIDITIGLIIGGFIALLSNNKEEWYPLWSGVFASNSLYMIVKALL